MTHVFNYTMYVCTMYVPFHKLQDVVCKLSLKVHCLKVYLIVYTYVPTHTHVHMHTYTHVHTHTHTVQCCQSVGFCPNIGIFGLKICLISIIYKIKNGYLEFSPSIPTRPIHLLVRTFFIVFRRSGQKMLAALTHTHTYTHTHTHTHTHSLLTLSQTT